MIKKVRIEEAVGLILAHDVTKVLPGKVKGPAFKRGHIIRAEDIPELLSIGKEHFYVMELEKGEIHEEEAASRIAEMISGPDLAISKPHEGRVDLIAEKTGVLKVNEKALNEMNMQEEIIIATIQNNSVCKKGMVVAGTRTIHLTITEERIIGIEEIAKKAEPVIALVPAKNKITGIIVTGSEVYKGLIQDGFAPILEKKLEGLGSPISSKVIVPDDSDIIAKTILEFHEKGIELILCCSGMSKDPDDVTAEGIRRSGAKVRFYGIPVLPGAMLLYAKLEKTAIIGVPACVLFAATTALDLILPRVLTDEELTFENTRELGHGGLLLKPL